jgi:hypothetical protein
MVRNQASQSFHAGAVVRQGDALLSTLFNLVLHTAIQDFQILGTTVNQLAQLFSSADVTALTSHSTAVLKELFQGLKREGRLGAFGRGHPIVF